MDSHEEQLRNARYRDWVKAGLALKYLKEGIEEFVDDEVKEEHKTILEDVRKEIGRPDATCDQCSIDVILPEHKKVNCSHGNRCFCRYDPQHKRRPCPNNVCGRIFDKIMLHRMHDRPAWSNTDSTKWCNNHWEIAKCFLDGGGYEGKDTAADTDCKGLLSIITNNMFVQKAVDTPIDKYEPKIDAFSKSKEARNEILHLASLQLSAEKLTEYIDVMLQVLEDKGKLHVRNDSKQATCKLKQLKDTGLFISTQDELEIRRSALQAIQEKKAEALDEIDKKQKEITEMSQTDNQQIKQLTDKLDKLADTSTKNTQILSNRQELLENRQTLIEGIVMQLRNAQTQTAEKLNELLKDISTVKTSLKSMETAAMGHEKDLGYLTHKQGFQEYLVNLYKRHEITTSISPLKTENNNINICDVYVSPEMVSEERNNDTKRVSGYCDIFNSNNQENKKIMLIGDVGTGKSSFCKMMIYNWCEAINREKHVIEEEDAGKARNHWREIEEIGRFDVLLHIPLRNVAGASEDLIDMVKLQFPKYKSFIDELFERESARCLILADGLDEWSPPIQQRRPIKFGSPSSYSVQDATVLTTSRPSAQSVLKLKGTDCDAKIRLLGIPYTSVHVMIEKYMRKLDKEASVSNFMKKLRESDLGELEKKPLLLQQVIWTYCYGHDIGKTQSIIYCSILNIMFGWLEEKGESLSFTAQIAKCLRLPDHLEKYPRCRANQVTIFLLGKIAFETYLLEGSFITFGRSKLQQFGLSDENISAFLRLGILNEERCPDTTYESTKFSFVHTSFLEFFAALFIASHCNGTESQSSNARVQIDMLEVLVKKNRSTTYILKIRNLLTMLCGLDPAILKEVSSFIYSVVATDECMTTYRRNQVDPRNPTCLGEIRQIQNLIHHCLTESGTDEICGSNEDVKITVSDFIMNYGNSLTFMQKFSAKHVLLLYISTTKLSKETLQVVKNLHHAIKIENCELNHNEFSELTTAVSGAEYLKELVLINIKCAEYRCSGHVIDLSKLYQLERFAIWKCRNLIVSDLNVSKLESCKISQSACSCVLALPLAEAAHLRELELVDISCTYLKCKPLTFISLNSTHLQRLFMEKCEHPLFSSENFVKLESCEIRNCSYSSAQYQALVMLLTRAVHIRRLVLNHVSCQVKESGDYDLDLSNHRQLQSLVAYGCTNLFVTDINFLELESCEIVNCSFSSRSCAALTLSLTRSIHLRKLVLDGIRAHCEENCESIDLSNQTQFKELVLKRCEKLNISKVNDLNLEFCKIENCSYTNVQYAELLFSLSDALYLKQLKLLYIRCSDDTSGHYELDFSNHKQLHRVMLRLPHGLNVFNLNLSNLHCFELKKKSLPKVLYREYILELGYGEIIHSTPPKKLFTTINLPSTSDNVLSELLLEGILCPIDTCQGHTFDLSNYNQLHRIDLLGCKQINVSGINFSELKMFKVRSCYFSGSQCASLASLVQNAVYLKELSFVENTCSADASQRFQIDLSKHEQLERIVIKSQWLSLSRVSFQKLMSFEMTDCSYVHSQYIDLAASLSNTVSLKDLKLVNIRCERHGCEGHEIDLSNHKRLQTLILQNCATLIVSAVKTLNLETFTVWNVSHRQAESLSAFLTNTPALKELLLENSREKSEENYVCVPNLVISDFKNLQRIRLYNVQFDNLLISADMPNITYIVLKGVRFDKNTWYRFIDSLLIVTQKMKIETYNLTFPQEMSVDSASSIRLLTT